MALQIIDINFDKEKEELFCELQEAFNLFDTAKNHEIDIDQFKEEFKQNLPNVSENEVNEICEFLKHENGNSINIQEAVQKLNAKVKSHFTASFSPT